MIRSSIEELVLTIDVLEGLDTFTFEDYFRALYIEEKCTECLYKAGILLVINKLEIGINYTSKNNISKQAVKMATNVSHCWPRMHRALSLTASMRKQKSKTRKQTKPEVQILKKKKR